MIRQIKSEKASVFLDALQKLSRKSKDVDERSLQHCFDVFQSMLIDLTSTEKLLFNTLFARIAFLGIQHKLPGEFVYELHLFRREVTGRQVFDESVQVFQLGLYLIGKMLNDFYKTPLPSGLSPYLSKPAYHRHDPKFETFHLYIRGLIISYSDIGKFYEFLPEENDGTAVRMYTDKLDLFQNTLQYVKTVIEMKSLPVTVILRDVGVVSDGGHYPKASFWSPITW